MAVFDAVFGADPKEEDQLAKAAPGEAENLQTHVELCARRYKTLSERLYAVTTKLRAQNRLLWAVIVLLILNIGPEKIALVSKLFV